MSEPTATAPAKPERAPRLGGNRQDEFTQEALCDILRYFPLDKGRYELDISDNGMIKLSRISKRWIQEADCRQDG